MTDAMDIDTAPRVLTRRRLEQLRDVGLLAGVAITRRRFSYIGPLAPLDQLLDEDVTPTADMPALGGTPWSTDDDVPWGSVMVYVEPLWRITEGVTGWKVWEDWGSPYDASDLTNQHWRTEDLARRYLELLTDDFWTKIRG